MSKKLFIPGPVDVREDVLAKMATPLIGHRSQEAAALQERVSRKLQRLMQTDNVVLLSTSSGTGLMEAAIRCCTRKRAAVFSVGSFGERWYELAACNRVPADKFESEAGQPTTPEMVTEALKTGKYDVVTITHSETSVGVMNDLKAISEAVHAFDDVLILVDAVSSLGGVPIPVDELGLDVVISSAQKCFGLPPGLSVCSVSQRAYEAAKANEFRGYYLDLVQLYDKHVKSGQYPSTPSLSHYFAFDYQLDRILVVEGLENRFARHQAMADLMQGWAEKYFACFAAPGYRSTTITCIENTREIDVPALVRELDRRNYVIGNGYGIYKNKTFRIAHMAETTPAELQALLAEIEDILGLEA